MGVSIIHEDQQQLCEYQLQAYPDMSIVSMIRELKQSFSDDFKQQDSVKNKPAITLVNFMAKESMEDTLIRYIHRVCSQQVAFTVTFNNYSGFPPHTIYLRIQETGPLLQLASKLKVIDEYIQSNGCPEARFMMRPYLPIAGSLNLSVYDKAMPHYSQETFHESFQLTELVLVKRNNLFEVSKEINLFRFYPPDINNYNKVA